MSAQLWVVKERLFAVESYIDIASSYKAKRGGKILAARTLTANDFKKSDEYQGFYLDFDVLSDESELEFRIAPTSGYVLTLDYIQLTRSLVSGAKQAKDEKA